MSKAPLVRMVLLKQDRRRFLYNLVRPTFEVRMFCTQCGTEIPNDAKFCRNCGRQIQEPMAKVGTLPTVYPENPHGYVQASSRVQSNTSRPLPQPSVTSPGSNSSSGRAIDAICPKCGTHFSGEPKTTFLTFKKLTCPNCRSSVTYPLSSKVRTFYFCMLMLGLAGVAYALTHGYVITGPAFIGCAIAYALIKDFYVRWRVARTAATFPSDK